MAACGYPSQLLTESEQEHLVDDPPVSHKIIFEVTSALKNADSDVVTSKVIGNLVLALFGTTVPKTVNNFVGLSNMTYGYGYQDVPFHRIINNFMVQGGDVPGPSKSIYGTSFEDENFMLQHNKLGRLSMANAGPNTNGGQFFITTRIECGWLDGHHVVFGQLVDGFDVLEEMNNVPTDEETAHPIDTITISKIDIITMYNTGVIVHDVENPEVIELIEPTTNYSYLFIMVLLGVVFYFAKKVYFKRQYIIDIKDKDYY